MSWVLVFCESILISLKININFINLLRVNFIKIYKHLNKITEQKQNYDV